MKRIFSSFFLSLALARAQDPLSVAAPAKLVAERGADPSFTLRATLRAGYHANSDKPSERYLIPLTLTWDTHGPLDTAEIKYPAPRLQRFSFADRPLAVVSGEFTILTRFRRKPNALPGPAFMKGALRYQACDQHMCLPPKTVDVKLPVLVR
jgi:thiol:disulfide interchange protein DsbD